MRYKMEGSLLFVSGLPLTPVHSCALALHISLSPIYFYLYHSLPTPLSFSLVLSPSPSLSLYPLLHLSLPFSTPLTCTRTLSTYTHTLSFPLKYCKMGLQFDGMFFLETKKLDIFLKTAYLHLMYIAIQYMSRK